MPDEDTPRPRQGKIERVLLTGATGFVGRYVLRELLKRGYSVVCPVRSRAKLAAIAKNLDQDRIAGIEGSLSDSAAMRDAADQSDAAIHLVGIILEHMLSGQTFDRIHRIGTMAVVDALQQAGIKRYVHMSALGARPDAAATYHKTKFAAEQYVKQSDLDWTIFQPSVIHGHDGEFMQLMKTFACRLIPPVMPYFGSGEGRLQPVSVKDVAYCISQSLTCDETIKKAYPMGGPKTYSWKELYRACKRLMPGTKRWKPLAALPVPVAKLLAVTIMKTPLVPTNLKFNIGQVQMAREDSTCATDAVESTFGIKLRDFEDELARYAELIK